MSSGKCWMSAWLGLAFLAGCGSSPRLLWCHAPQGAACKVAQSALALEHTPTSKVPDELLSNIRGSLYACDAPDVADEIGLLTTTFENGHHSWLSHKGDSLNRQQMPAAAAGGGCTNWDPNEPRPTFKIHDVRDITADQRVLIRVWETSPE